MSTRLSASSSRSPLGTLHTTHSTSSLSLAKRRNKTGPPSLTVEQLRGEKENWTPVLPPAYERTPESFEFRYFPKEGEREFQRERRRAVRRSQSDLARRETHLEVKTEKVVNCPMGSVSPVPKTKPRRQRKDNVSDSSGELELIFLSSVKVRTPTIVSPDPDSSPSIGLGLFILHSEPQAMEAEEPAALTASEPQRSPSFVKDHGYKLGSVSAKLGVTGKMSFLELESDESDTDETFEAIERSDDSEYEKVLKGKRSLKFWKSSHSLRSNSPTSAASSSSLLAPPPSPVLPLPLTHPPSPMAQIGSFFIDFARRASRKNLHALAGDEEEEL
ncbi:hypothetical protein BT69DRAFT_1316983 [Atractiella rhizophila]|nr:hypothetical protein BT69DRAFT_1316983 [Atractiella rhizophila]